MEYIQTPEEFKNRLLELEQEVPFDIEKVNLLLKNQEIQEITKFFAFEIILKTKNLSKLNPDFVETILDFGFDKIKNKPAYYHFASNISYIFDKRQIKYVNEHTNFTPRIFDNNKNKVFLYFCNRFMLNKKFINKNTQLCELMFSIAKQGIRDTNNDGDNDLTKKNKATCIETFLVFAENPEMYKLQLDDATIIKIVNVMNKYYKKPLEFGNIAHINLRTLAPFCKNKNMCDVINKGLDKYMGYGKNINLFALKNSLEMQEKINKQKALAASISEFGGFERIIE